MGKSAVPMMWLNSFAFFRTPPASRNFWLSSFSKAVRSGAECVRSHVQLLVHVCIATKMSLSKYFQAKLPTPSVAEKPHQPLSFKFPKREFGKKSVVKRSFQPQWFARWKWLHYDEERDLAFCFTCVKAYKENKLHPSANVETTYISTGYSNWKQR